MVVQSLMIHAGAARAAQPSQPVAAVVPADPVDAFQAALMEAPPVDTSTQPPPPNPFNGRDVEDTVRYFQAHGRVYRRKLFFWKREVTVDEAAERLADGKSIYVKHASGSVDKIKSFEQLQTLDTLDGQALKPNLAPRDVEALRAFESGKDKDDGLFRHRLGLFEHKLNAYEAWQRLEKGKSVEVRNDGDSGLKINSMDDARDLYGWVLEQQDNPFTRTQAVSALEYFDQNGGLFGPSGLFGRRHVNPESALDRLRSGKAVHVPSSIPGHDQDTMRSLRQLQELDTVRGHAVNPMMHPDEAAALRWLEKGAQPGDGMFKGSVLGKQGLDAYEATESLLREHRTIGVRIRNKDYTVHTLGDTRYLNAFQGEQKNTVLPQAEYDAIKYFDKKGLLQVGDKSADAYEAWQAMQKDTPALASSAGRRAQVLSPADCHELFSLEISGKNDILEQEQYDLLQFWQKQGESSATPSYRVDGNEAARAYEALQSQQAGTEFDVRSHGRWAPAVSFQDLEDLAAFEGFGFPVNVPGPQKTTLEFFQGDAERAKHNGFRVGAREGRAYEGWRELRDGKPFDVWAGGAWNTVLDRPDLHELDCLLGIAANDIMPQDQFYLLKQQSDQIAGEGLASGGVKLTSYQALQEIQAGRGVSYDFDGGDFGEGLHVPTKKLEDLDETRILVANQKEYDKYRYTVPEFKDKMERQKAVMPDAASENLKYGQRKLSEGQQDLSAGESHKRRGESDRSRGQSDLSSAQSRMMWAQAMPMYVPVTHYRQVCDSQGHCRQEPYTVMEFNWQRQWAINAAQSAINDAESDIRRAEEAIRRAEREIAEAQREISVAQGQIRDANQVLSMLSGFGALVDSVNDGNFGSVSAQIQSQLDQMKRLSHVAPLNLTLTRQTKLITNMSARPERPAGWKVPQPLVQS